ncbi:uncharacterized protein N7506_004298 [Penicillium brevicompactum]|uniref:uncharacterized protein n=1 Tax=Penicillium brevicompactum TaxID=5074 RepID=UPI0025409A20|nr:uncharacterized protein N7506_004298 [Penicillium brevicompactum]KAJ5336276.1 hypothetical protein N7506_004298 [Penicillium brevicompactum]
MSDCLYEKAMGKDPAVPLASEDPAIVFGSMRSVQSLRQALLAPWYDLNDSKRHFTDVVPVRARYNPLLLSSILAFAAANQHRTVQDHVYLDMAEFYHYDSVRRLISLTNNVDQLPIGETLAAICLLRSYEIITPNRQIHPKADLISAGYWNYLREDITVALIEQRGLMITLSDQNKPPELSDDTDHANYVTFLLGKIINRCLSIDSPALSLSEWEAIKDELGNWKSSLPSSFDVIETPGLRPQSSFSSIWTLRSWHAMGILWLAQPAARPLKALQRMNDVEDLHRKLESHATEICALACSSDSAPVWVNAFGPIAFCGPWLRNAQKRLEIAEELRKWGEITGWPVSFAADAFSPPAATNSATARDTIP